jgi:hypothetical protein
MRTGKFIKMNKRTLSLVIISIAAIVSALKCNDDNIANIYNRLTEPYRQSNHESSETLDTALTVKAVDIVENKPLQKASVKLTPITQDNPSQLYAKTDKFGNALISLKYLNECIYDIEVTLTSTGKTYYGRGDFFITKKNNPVITIYLVEMTPTKTSQ